ncbi:hypothetical protein GT347_18715 [Xylophilus rhododendri]|uniref:Uncharacterized protein n=2 Tax=Xylophilus rhododendri TaxID=2697032 RepID=A0A857J9C9_9BURK|nr:hypothetical protein GT347_18715 [Xylophilus rhododendri]
MPTFCRRLLLALACALAGQAAWAQSAGCRERAADECYHSMSFAGGALHYYASLPAGAGPTRAIVAMHGHPRDANRTFDATLLAARKDSALDDTLIVAPVFQVPAGQSGKCHAPGTPPPQDGDLLWTCASWLEGGQADNGDRPGSFAALDALVAELARRWPSLRGVTIAGFSAGAQMVQHYIGFARVQAARPLALRYVVADPGTWLYFDPLPGTDSCPAANQWKYGTGNLPAALGRSAAEARSQYAAADIHYLEGALDSADAPGAFYRILDKSCGAAAQGPFRLQRGQAYVEYERQVLTPGRSRPLTVVPGCAHDVSCVFPSDAARPALFGPTR